MKNLFLKVFRPQIYWLKITTENARIVEDLKAKIEYAEKRHMPVKQLRLDLYVANINFEKAYSRLLKERVR